MASACVSALFLAALHQSSVKYLDLAIEGDTITARMTVAPGDLTDALGLAPDATPSAIAAATPAAARYTRAWVTITGCTPGDAHAAPDLDGRFVAVSWTVRCAAAPTELDLDLGAFFAVDPRHEAIVRVGAEPPIVLRSSAPRWVIPVADGGIWRGWWLIAAGTVLVVVGIALRLRHLRRSENP